MITSLTNWIDQNPSPFASLIAATIAASVAILVFTLTQYFTNKRERTNFLTHKLEELYLKLNVVAENNARFFKLTYLALHGDRGAQQEIADNDIELYGHRTGKEIIMSIRLYFPELSKIHQMLFSKQAVLNDVIIAIHTEDPPPMEEIAQAFGKVGHFIRLMEAEIIRNRGFLVKDSWLFSRYSNTTEEEMKNELPMPEGPILFFTTRNQAPDEE